MDEFAAAAEFSIGYNTLDRFIVTNDHDASQLRQIRKQAGCGQDCGIFQIDPSPRYNIPGPLDFDGIERVSNVFTIENDIVFNCLIDNARMEHKAVARDRTVSQEKLLTKNGNQHAIREKINEVYLPNGDFWTVKGGSLAMFSNDKKLRQTVGVDRTAAIADAQAQLSQLDEELRKIQREESKLQSEHTNAQRQWNQAKRSVAQNAADIEAILERIENIKDEMKSSNNHTIDTTEMEEDIQQAEDLLARHKATEERFLAEREAMLPHINELKARLEESSIRNARILEDISLAERELTQFLETQTQQNDKLEKKRQKLRKYQDDLETLNQQLDVIAARRDDFLLKARIMHFRVQQQQRSSQPDDDGEKMELQPEIREEPTDEELEAIEPIVCKHEPSWYELRIKKIDEKIRSEKSRRKVLTEDAATVYERYIRAKADLSEKTDQVAITDKRIEDLQKDVEIRRKRWRQFRKHLAKSTALKFDEMLSMNKYTGTLDFDDDNRTLDLAVQKNTADTQSDSKDVKALRYDHRYYIIFAILYIALHGIFYSCYASF
jgi:chromosome segregation ATPase